jgi:hypothetical protein
LPCCVCFKLSLFATCTALPAGGRTDVRACILCLRPVGLGGEKKWGRDGDHQSSTDHDPAYRSFLFFPPLFFCSKFVFVLMFLPPFRFVKVCGSLGVSSVRIRLLGILHFTFHTRPCFFLLANRH